MRKAEILTTGDDTDLQVIGFEGGLPWKCGEAI
jgi:hypothetical protein